MKISVAMCTYNGEKYLKDQIESILNQSLPVDEIIVCDDRSSDGTKDILEYYKSIHPNLFNISYNQTSLKTVKNFEKAILKTSGDIIFLSDQDDIWKIDKVKIILDVFSKNENAKMIFTDGDLIDASNNLLDNSLFEKWDFPEEKQNQWKNNKFAVINLINWNNKITGATMCFRKSLINKFVPINPPCDFWHDAWIGMHAARENGLFISTEKLIQYRIHSEQQVGLSKKSKNPDNELDCDMLKKQYSEYLQKEFSDYFPYFDHGKRSVFRKVKNKIVEFKNLLQNTKN